MILRDMHLERSEAKKLVTFAIYCTVYCCRESCKLETEKSIGAPCGELQRVFFLKVPRMEFFFFKKYANLSFL